MLDILFDNQDEISNHEIVLGSSEISWMRKLVEFM